MALKGISESLAARGIQSDLKLLQVAAAGAPVQLESVTGYARLASNSVTHVLDWDVSATGISAAEILFGVEVQKTKVDEPARLRPLAPGDTFLTTYLASGSDTGALSGAIAPNTPLSVDPATGKIRVKQAADPEFFRLASDGGNLFDSLGAVWVEVMALK
jgi:hypothetical protein